MIERAAVLAAPHEFERSEEFRDSAGRVVASVRGLPDAVEQLRRLGRPFLNWAGKAERLSFDVPTLPLFIHERLSTQAILETLKGHRRDRQMSLFDLFADPQHPIQEQIFKAYEYQDGWVNRLILGDSLVVMNSLLRYEGLGGKVQMIYMDPPYGVKFGSNFQPFVRKRDVSHNDDEDMTREPEMVKAYRDTWELGLHSYLSYLRDRLLMARELLAPSGSVFVQISDENLHHVREVMDEVFGGENCCSVITFTKTGGQSDDLLASVADYVLWYARDVSALKYRQLYLPKLVGGEGGERYTGVELPTGERMTLSEVVQRLGEPPEGSRFFRKDTLTSQRPPGSFPVSFEGKNYFPTPNYWKTGPEGMQRLIERGRVVVEGNRLAYLRYHDDFPVFSLHNVWSDVGGVQSRSDPKIYVVQTASTVIQRCLLMTTDPGDLVLDPTCGSGTTAYVAEQWGRRWITIDVSRVPLALARQRLLTATFPYYELKDPALGPAGGFVYMRKRNKKGEEVGGIVPHITLKSIANDELPKEEVLVDRPEVASGVVRVTGPFTVEATIPTPVDWEESPHPGPLPPSSQNGGEGTLPSPAGRRDGDEGFAERMLEILRRSPVLHVGGGKTVTLKNIRPPAKTLSLSAEALVEPTAPGQKVGLGEVIEAADAENTGQLSLSARPVAIVFGPENGAVSDRLVFEAAREAYAKSYTHLYVFGFAIQPSARELVEQCEAAVGVPAIYVQATPDLTMGDLLKNMRSSQIFSVCGLPEVKLKKLAPAQPGEAPRYQMELLGLDVFDPATMDTDHRGGNDVPAWFLDTDYNGLCFHVCQAFFPRTAAWDNLKRSLRGHFDDAVWDHLAGSVSAPFGAGEQRQVAVKVIDDRGNELMVVKSLREARP